MLLNNFKPLLFLGGNGSFTNVLGNSVNSSTILNSEFYQYTVLNSHQTTGSARSFNYNTTTGANAYTQEKTTYNWRGVTEEDINSTTMVPTSNGFTLFVGNGNTAVTSSDYCLDNAIELDVTASSCTTNSNGIVTVQRTFENNTGSVVTISELGLYFFRTGGYLAESPIVMIGRKVFDSAVTIPDGEQRTFEYIIYMNHINFTETDN